MVLCIEDFVLLYDADCGFCRWSLAKVLAWDRDRRLRPMPLQDPRARGLLGEMSEERAMASWHLVLPDGRVRSAGEAFPPLLRLLPGGGPLATITERLAGPTDLAYRLVAGNRSVLGPLVTARAAERARARIAQRGGAPGVGSCGRERDTVAAGPAVH